jgi:hypothetical protein
VNIPHELLHFTQIVRLIGQFRLHLSDATADCHEFRLFPLCRAAVLLHPANAGSLLALKAALRVKHDGNARRGDRKADQNHPAASYCDLEQSTDC